jgi:hypothetical protein
MSARHRTLRAPNGGERDRHRSRVSDFPLRLFPLESPLWSGALVAFLTTAASMIAFINSIVAGTGVTLLANSLVGHDQIRLTMGLGVMATVILMAVFLAYQRRRYRDAEAAAPREEAEPRQ